MTSPKQVLILDGGTGTALAGLGHESVMTDELWCSGLVKTHPQDVQKLHRDYFVSGADAVMTATYQASVDGYMQVFGVTEAGALDLLREGVELAKAGRDEAEKQTGRRGYVFASVGPRGACMCDRSEYHGRYVDSMSAQELISWHQPRLQALTSAEPDMVAMETVPALVEALAMIQALHYTGSPVKTSVTFTLKDAHTTAHGEDIREALSTVAADPAVVAVGANCFDLDQVEPFLLYIKDAPLSGKPVIVKPNGGKYSPHGWTEEKGELAERAVRWVEMGASWIGGCCATDGHDIRRIRTAMERAPGVEMYKSGAQLH